MAHLFVDQIKAGQQFEDVFMVTQPVLRNTTKGDLYIAMFLSDKTGKLNGRMWQASEELYASLPSEGFVQIRGKSELYQNALQIIINDIKVVPAEKVDLSDYMPQTEKDIPNCVTSDQRKKLPEINRLLRETIPALYITLPGEEEQYGGCLAAGRGFVHISATGDVEPCPFAPYSDTNINHSSYTEALDSLLLNRIRNNHHMLKESAGGCTLWENKEWVKEQLDTREPLSA